MVHLPQRVYFSEMINKLFSSHLGLPFIGGIFLCGILAAIMSTADSQLLVTASAASEDLYHQFIKKDADSKEILAVARLTVIVVSVLAFVIAWNPNSSIMGLVSNAWAGLGAAFGPTVVMSLFWRRTNLAGAVAGIVSGGLTVIVWDLYTVCSRTDSWFLYRTLFSGCRFCCQPCDDHYLQSGYKSTIQRNHRCV